MVSDSDRPHAEEPGLDRERGTFRSVVTHLVMDVPPRRAGPVPPHPDVRVAQWERPAVDEYIALFRRVGDRWLWHGRLSHGRGYIEHVLRAESHEVWRLWRGGDVAGLCELNRSRSRTVRIDYFGLVDEQIGTGLGGFFMRKMLREAWRSETLRVVLTTCTEDHPAALGFYQHMGFRITGKHTEWIHDPRLRGILPRDAGPHVPIPE